MQIRTITLTLLASLPLLSPGAAAAQEAKPAAPPAAAAAAKPEAPVLVGPTTREAVESFAPDWVEAEVAAHPEAEAASALAAIEPGCEIDVYFGTWCGDSRREVPRFWKALDQLGGSVPFTIRYVAVDRAKKEPATAIANDEVRYLPTFIVRRAGHEVGRIVESSPNGVEKDLGALLAGKASGLLTLRTDLGGPGGHPEAPVRKPQG